jgi:hypothetical protein
MAAEVRVAVDKTYDPAVRGAKHVARMRSLRQGLPELQATRPAAAHGE